VVFLSDNGGATRELTSSNAPLRGEKGTLFEGGIRVPFIVRWPAKLPGGRAVSTPVISLDLAATALKAAGIHSDPSALDGVDLPSLLTHPAPAPRTFYWRMGQRRALRHGDWKIVRDAGRSQDPKWLLFNLATDPSEKNDLAAQEPARIADLVRRWDEWNATQKPPLW
jgi:arylsulfatase B